VEFCKSQNETVLRFADRIPHFQPSESSYTSSASSVLPSVILNIKHYNTKQQNISGIKASNSLGHRLNARLASTAQ